MKSSWMRRCLELASRARGRTAPNPMVGAMVLSPEGEVLAEGWHRAPGQAHAEVDALEKLGGRAPGCTIVVNLEPCCHHGRTPPCTEALLAAGIQRVIVGMVDPDPRVRGQGIAQLRAAGLEVEVGVEEAACRDLNRAFLSAQERKRPWVVLKAAMTLDGRIADREGRSQWITGREARTAGHALRDQCDAILVGAGTVRADDPALTARLPGARDPLPVVLDSRLSLSSRAQLLQPGRRTLLCCAEDAPSRELPVEVLRLPRGEEGQLSLAHLMPALVQRGLHSLLVEGGGQVHRSFLAAGLVDRLHLFVAPSVLGEGPSWVAAPGWGLGEAPRLRRVAQIERGVDTELILEP